MSLEEIYKAFVQEHDTDTAEGEAALDTAGDNDRLFETIAEGLISKHRAGFFAGFRAAVQLMQEVAS